MQRVDDGGPAFPFAATDPSNVPMQAQGMTLRDWFATNMDRDEYGDIAFHDLSLMAKEALAGPRPLQPDISSDWRDKLGWQLAMIRWELSVRAAIRFIYADAMLAARKGGSDV